MGDRQARLRAGLDRRQTDTQTDTAEAGEGCVERAGTDESIVLVLGVQGLAGLGSVNVYGKVKGYVFDSI